ncbi:MAG TPA: carboxypeptidase-like regulatory domain-containing protein, partial [Anseongella sp.]
MDRYKPKPFLQGFFLVFLIFFAGFDGMSASFSAWQDPVKVEVKGIVTDSIGPIPNVSVSVKDNPQIGTLTDLNGRFILLVPVSSVLVFQMVGFSPQEIKVTQDTDLNIVLKPSTEA